MNGPLNICATTPSPPPPTHTHTHTHLYTGICRKSAADSILWSQGPCVELSPVPQIVTTLKITWHQPSTQYQCLVAAWWHWVTYCSWDSWDNEGMPPLSSILVWPNSFLIQYLWASQGSCWWKDFLIWCRSARGSTWVGYTCSKQFFQWRILALMKCWRTYINHNRDYVEKWQSCTEPICTRFSFDSHSYELRHLQFNLWL
jgi:hypothetical protein